MDQRNFGSDYTNHKIIEEAKRKSSKHDEYGIPLYPHDSEEIPEGNGEEEEEEDIKIKKNIIDLK